GGSDLPEGVAVYGRAVGVDVDLGVGAAECLGQEGPALDGHLRVLGHAQVLRRLFGDGVLGETSRGDVGHHHHGQEEQENDKELTHRKSQHTFSRAGAPLGWVIRPASVTRLETPTGGGHEKPVGKGTSPRVRRCSTRTCCAYRHKFISSRFFARTGRFHCSAIWFSAEATFG